MFSELNKSDTKGHVTGIVHELVVCIDLLRKGFEVFKAVSGSATCDLAVLKNGKLWRVEVTTAYRTLSGGTLFNIHEESKYDLFALVFKDGEIQYRPDISTI